MNKKGFTLVELLAVIAILAILVIIALPNVLRMFRNAKENTFVTEVQEIVKTAEQGYISGSLSNKECKCFSSASNPLDLSGRDNIQYYVEFNDKGQVINLTVKDDTYQFVSEGEVIKIADIGSSTSGKEKTTSLALESTEVPSCNGSSESGNNKTDIKYESMIKEISSYDYYENTHFLEGILERDKIESIKFANAIPEEIKNKYQQQDVKMAASADILGIEDITNDNSENIMMWWTDTDEDGLYEVTIGGEGGVKANTNSSYLFVNMSNLTSIDLTYLDTSKVTNMMGMFYGCIKLTMLDVSHLNTSSVTNMRAMFGAVGLETLDLSNFDTSLVTTMGSMFTESGLQTIIFGEKFDTSKVEDMTYMFAYCPRLTTLDLSHFVIREDANLECMFDGTDNLTNEPYIKYNPDYEDRLKEM